MTKSPPLDGSRLLALLPKKLLRGLEPLLEPIALERLLDLYLPNKPIENIYFPTKGVVSIVKHVEGDKTVEIATVGPEGMVGIPMFLGSRTTDNHAFVQIPGAALRMDAGSFRKVVRESPKFQLLLSRYVLAFLNQIAQNAACNRTHNVDERCARWLLMTHDRVGEDEFSLTQDLLAQMLGVHRPTVSIAASMLQKEGHISYARGIVTMLNRKGLEEASCDCYAAVNREYRRLLH